MSGFISKRYAVSLVPVSRFAPTIVAGFVYDPECDRHIYDGRKVTNIAQLAELVNQALTTLRGFCDPFLHVEVIVVPDKKKSGGG